MPLASHGCYAIYAIHAKSAVRAVLCCARRYFVLITLTTVGYGDVVATTFLGKAVVLAMICLGVVAIPVQAAQVYAELSARRVVLGE